MSTQTYRALVVSEESDGSFRRSIREKPLNDLPDGDIQVRVRYSSLNYKDALSATGNKGVTKHYPHTPGIDAAGVVEQSHSRYFKPGDKVVVNGFDLGADYPGGFAEYVSVPADWVMKLPEGMSLRDTMVMGVAGLTAALSVYRLTEYGIRPDGGPVLVTGATGGVGSIAVAILAKLGFQVTAATGKREQVSMLKDLGARDVIPRKKAHDTSGKPLLKRRWNAAVDTVGGETLSTVIRATSYGGAVTCCGMVGGTDLPLTVFPFILRGVSLFGIDLAFSAMGLRETIWDRLSHQWKPDLPELLVHECGLEGLEERIALMLSGAHIGRTVVRL
ncbi:MAG: acryloyl-CoA reductase [Chitinivibrionales bacterium]|nr:acryloyl-CoA reductase [Chitinivibrionales bacterium]MBD3395785.1 acryloyl-CoA reductase [Chitinivibrionales bacterium]